VIIGTCPAERGGTAVAGATQTPGFFLPATVSAAELKRIQDKSGFQLLVVEPVSHDFMMLQVVHVSPATIPNRTPQSCQAPAGGVRLRGGCAQCLSEDTGPEGNGFGFQPLSADRMFLPMKKAAAWLKPSAP
jgi:hypothetical protein